MKTFPTIRSMRQAVVALALMMISATLLTAQRAQIAPQPKPANQAHVRPGEKPVKLSPFSRTASRGEFSKNVRKAAWLSLDAQALSPVLSERPRNLEVRIPGPDGQDIDLILEQSAPMMANAKVFTPQGEAAYKRGVHYQGKVASRDKRGGSVSMASMSIVEGEISAVIATEKEGNMVLGRVGSRAENSTDYVFYKENDLLVANPLECKADHDTHTLTEVPVETEALRGSSAGKLVRVYVEVDNTLFNRVGGTVAAAVNYVNALFNVSQMIYERENVKTQISEVFVWTTPDSYSSTSSGTALDNFGTRLNALGSFNGDLAHLFSGDNAGGGIAWIGVLCYGNIGQRAAYSGSLYNSINNFPAYSWEAMVVTHEMGHNLGSNHTQWCGWPGGALDNCYTTEGGCAAGLAPINGGTVMSYCHLTSGGINLAHGFGYYPGNAIRSSVSGAGCLSYSGLSCWGAEDIVSGVTKSGSTVGLTAGVNYYSGLWWYESGPEKVYRIVTTEPGTITAELSNVSADVDVFILDACSESNMKGYGNNNAYTPTLPAGEYYIVVDGYNGAAGTFDLRVTASGYCFTFGNTDDEFIQRVEFDGYSNTSGNNRGYADFSNDRIIFRKGQLKSYSLVPGYRATNYPENWHIWLDRDDDKVLGESGEELLSTGAIVGAANGMINIPHGSLFAGGQFGRMRVQMNYSAPFEACGEIGFGEVEDYSFFLDDYCLAQGSNNDEWIGRVQIGEINNYSGRASYGYGNHASTTTFIQKGAAIPYTLEPAFAGASYAEAWRVWIDLNNDYEFDASELVLDLPAAGTAQSGTFTIPVGASTNGWKRMRVQMKYLNSDDACGSFAYGEVEDYTVYLDDYCQSKGDGGLNYLGSVTLGSIYNTSSFFESGYNDYTHLSAVAPIGSSIPFTFNPNFLFFAPSPQAFTVFADFNRDNDFEDNGEYLFSLPASTSPQSGNLQIPMNATPGDVRVRIVMRDGAPLFQPCGTGFDGETEDYTLNLVQLCGAPTGFYAVPQSLSTAAIGFDMQSGASNYNFRYRVVGAATWRNATAAVSYKGITGLTAGANYEMQVQVRCPDGSVTPWTASYYWVQPSSGSACGATFVGAVRNIATTDATAHWAFVNGATKYRLQYRPEGGSVWVQLDLNTPYKTLTGLNPNTRYEVRVAVRCGTVWGAFSPISDFKTLPTLSLGAAGDDRSEDDSELENAAENDANALEMNDLKAFPNPFGHSVTIEFDSPNAASAQLEVLNLTGQVIVNQTVETTEGINKIALETGDWASGFYMVRLQIGETLQTLKVVKQ